MDSTRWQKVQSLFHEAADLPASERRVFLETQCGEDAGLVSEVLILLEEDARGGSLLDGDVAEVASQILDDSSPGSLPFKEFGPYKIKQALGEGGMGVVYLAEREDLGNEVAIKILRDAWVSPARRERFNAEQRTLAQLNHPSIARLYDADTSPDGTPFFVMEYVQGVPLTNFCKAQKCSIPARLRLFRAVCEAVLYAHQHAVIHRDLKPSNILVKADGSIRLLDFGISKHLENLGELVDQTITGLRMMTPAYAAPEQIRGQQIGIQSDVYSLGVVLYELLAGRLPFELSDCTPAQAEKILTEQEAEKPSTVAKKEASAAEANGVAVVASRTAWADLDVLCLTAMHKDPQRRYQSVEALIRDVDHYLDGEPLEARPDTWHYTLGKFVRRHWQLVSASAAMFLLLVGLVIFYTVRLTRARNAAVTQAARTQRIQRFMLNLFQGGDPSAGPADDLRVVTLLDRGVQEARSLDAEPAVQAELYETLGGIYQKLGKLEQADSLMESALAKREALYGPDSTETAKGLLALGSLRAAEARYSDAERLIRQALDRDKRHLPANDPAVAKAMLALGGVLEDRGNYDQSIAILEQTVQLYSAPGSEPADLADSLYELANAHFYAGHYQRSEEINERILTMYKQIYGERHPRVADVLINLGAIRLDLGHYPEAEQYDRQALDIVQGWYGKDNPETATDLTILARSLVYQKRFDEASDLLQQSLAIKERTFGKVHPSVASTLNELGSVALQEGKYDPAEQYFERMADIYRTEYGEQHYLFATALSNLASVYTAQQQWTRAEKLYRQAIPIYTESQSPTHINTGIARIKLGRTLLRQQRFAEAEAESHAGYDILVTQMDPKVSWLMNARKDLAAEYEGLNQPEQAAKFRAEIAANEAKPPEISAKK
ncbi:MAG TPA: tetratricopeptide repeat protein [Candidatus Acidoferrales bacterium]